MKQLKYVRLWNNYSDKEFKYTGEEFYRYFHDTILTIRFKLKNQGHFVSEDKAEEPPIELVFQYWNELAIRHNPEYEKSNYSILEFK